MRSRIRANVFVFNPLSEGYVAHGKGFTPVKHQSLLVNDLANLPQFLCRPDDIVLLAKRPSAEFLRGLKQAGFFLPEFHELTQGCIDPTSDLLLREIGGLRPWAWGPDSVELFKPFFARATGEIRTAAQCFNVHIARLYSKAWSAAFLRKVLAHFLGDEETQPAKSERLNPGMVEPWLCTGNEAGVAVDTLEEAFEAIAAIRRRGHHRVVAKEAHGLAGHNAIRLWEPEVLPAQRQWLARALRNGHQLVIEPWLERVMDFSIQLEMETNLKLVGYTGLINDRKGQFLANYAAANFSHCPPGTVDVLFPRPADGLDHLQRLYAGVICLLEPELQRAGFVGPVSIDAFVYRTLQGECRLKPIVEINPRYTMGRLTIELMKQTCPGSSGLFRIITRAQARAAGFAGFADYAQALSARLPLRLDGEPAAKIREGALCLNDPEQAQVCLAVFQVSRSGDELAQTALATGRI